MTDPLEQKRLRNSITGLHEAAPDMSALSVLSPLQRGLAVAVVLVLAAATVISPLHTMQVVLALTSVMYVATLGYRLVLVHRGMRGDHLVRVSDEEARAVPGADLPTYTVLVPAYREPTVIAAVVAAVSALEYPTDKLDVRLLLEADDEETIAAARESIGDGPITVVLVPPEGPRTKPKACNYGLQSALGALITIYDAEDHPEPLQLRRAVVALDRLGDGHACVQARLGYYNSRQNMITRWFSVEYAHWFGFLLPGLVAVGAPVPLGGTSNHFRADVLRSVGAWDPYNVTEDADLGIRIARLGYQIGVLDSLTEEEANSDLVNWIKQRSRWYKGYLQTWLVHMRHPVRVHRELGWRGVLGLHLFVAGTPLTTMLNPFFWALTMVWWVDKPHWIQTLFPPVVFYLALASLLVGNTVAIYLNVFTTRAMRRPDLLVAAVLAPLYWVMMGLAAVKATVQLVHRPSYWEKTSHGLHLAPAAQTAVSR
jgi:cellulose synthase/poly-beta-1,6-N-acetylglucosamine synthase-like glycosyltransferase